MSISGLVVEYIVAIDVTRARSPADALSQHALYTIGLFVMADVYVAFSKCKYQRSGAVASMLGS